MDKINFKTEAERIARNVAEHGELCRADFDAIDRKVLNKEGDGDDKNTDKHNHN